MATRRWRHAANLSPPTAAATLPVLVSLFGFTAITMSFGHLHEVVCRPKSLDEWAISSKLERLQAHLMGYVPQIFAWALVVGQFLEAGGSSTTDSKGERSSTVKVAPLAVPQLGSCASSGRAWWPRAARHSQGGPWPLGSWPRPQVVERAA